MTLDPGTLDRLIVIERRAVAQDPDYGTSQGAWETLAEVWAQVRDVLPSRAESLDDNISILRRPARVRMRYRDDLTGDMRVKLNGKTMRIIAGPAELGRREGIELMVEEISTDGEAA
ncbi:phage head closure protein [Sphingobium agri]|uniref:Phage head closure protein n=1 Tax=Sphingobium agri TaxID=2933566 RepID=A0ABT0DXF5_9SPHN|nr:phage head closure protein [Sphingobium agri]MCK0531769.1 phage head closure protein [Sphingobium agri]